MRLLCIFLLLSLATPALATPKVVVSIIPIYSLVSALTRGVTTPELLLNQGGSPHSASLRPSQARALAEADLLIWVGPELESFLTQPISRLVKPGAEMRLLPIESLKRLPQRHGGFWEADDDEHDTGPGHSESLFNPHIWLSPDNALQICVLVAARLTRLDPSHQAIYQKNLLALKARIQTLSNKLKQQLKPLQKEPYLVFHDAYAYFENAFGLNPIGSIRVSADRAPGARRLQQIREKIIQSKARCLFSEPQFSPATAQRLADAGHLKLGVLDPLGNRSNSSQDDWFNLMQKLADNLTSCLKK
ncbi:zinc ABC transporter substrate-binding protein [Geopsychrobacter electrodiphilus]|uniref:zinc ABC transporter substrate-binding protein n=1 Tax=Geopsychrobacter electrodiphilus TaxID=225196 RepID=UPI000373D8CE|nr:zinc ABC transporter substrate-binding protein [Geopsychrobacter electrodiphilus]